jgi:predicted transcriptional regulator
MGRNAKLFTVEAIARNKGKSDSTVRRALEGATPAGYVEGYNGRQYAG